VELRILRFRHVHDVSILSEKVFSFLRMRQLLYFAFGILILWRAMSFRDPGALAFSMFVFLLGMVSAIPQQRLLQLRGEASPNHTVCHRLCADPQSPQAL
jgi:hypothetical protein